MTMIIRIPCRPHLEMEEPNYHNADLVCAATGQAMCGEAHIGADCACDYFDLDERGYASEFQPEYDA